MKIFDEKLNAITQRMKSETYLYFKFGDDYYRSRNTYIMQRQKKVYLETENIVAENPFGANHKIPSGHFKKIVIQKVMYLLGNGVVFSEDGQTDALDAYFKTSFDEFIIDSGIEASKKVEAWAYAYKDEKSKLKFTLIPAEQLTPVYDEYDELVKMFRRFDVGNTQVLLEIDENEIKRYERKNDKAKFAHVETYGHYTTIQEFNGQEEGEPIQHGFGRVPFIALYNNKERTSDLYPIKPLIDTYDIINSDFANNIDDMQDAFFTLKGYTGDTKNLAEFMEQLKKYKAIPVGENGEVTANQLQIPTEARSTFLKMLKNDIYEYAMAVDLKGMQGGSITNVYIKAMFSDLDLKCNEFENEVRKYIFALLDFINAVDGKTFTDEFTFDRSIIMNKQESVATLITLVGLLSDETVRELLPYDINLEQEKQRLIDEQDEVQFEPITSKTKAVVKTDKSPVEGTEMPDDLKTKEPSKEPKK